MSKDLITLTEANSKEEKNKIAEDDLNLIQDNLSKTQDKLTNHLNEVIEFSRQAQHPQIYNSIAKIASTISQLNKDALEVIKYKQFLNNQGNTKEESSITYNNTDARTINFVGTPSDLLKRIEKEEEEDGNIT